MQIPTSNLEQLFQNTCPEDVIFWSGAGISFPSPSSLPLGDDLTKNVINSFIPLKHLNQINKIFKNGGFLNPYGLEKSSFRLELIIQSIYNILGYKTYDLFDFFNLSSSSVNHYHLFFGSHILRGGTHFTMNLDTGIEKAISILSASNMEKMVVASYDLFESPYLDYFGKLVKLHGSIHDTGNYHNLGILLNNIVGGFSPTNSSKILAAMRRCKILVFIGYSGSDWFDVTKFLRTYLPGKINPLTIIWIKHSESAQFTFLPPMDNFSSISKNLSPLMNNQHNCFLVEGNAEVALLQLLRNYWQLPAISPVAPTPTHWQEQDHSRLARLALSEVEKRFILANIFASLGCVPISKLLTQSIEKSQIKQVAELDKGVTRSQDYYKHQYEISAHSFRGQYKEALRIAKKWARDSRRSNDPVTYFFACGQIFGNSRLGGMFIYAFYAYLMQKKALETLRNTSHYKSDPSLKVDEANLYCAYLFLLSHFFQLLDNFPKLTFFASKLIPAALKRHILEYWLKTYLFIKFESKNHVQFIDLSRIAGDFHAIQRAEFIDYAKQNSDLFDENDISINTASFLEADSLLGDINYTRKNLEINLATGKSNSDETINIANSLIKKARAIKDVQGLWKAYYILEKEYIKRGDKQMAIAYRAKKKKYFRKVEYGLFFKIEKNLDFFRTRLKHLIS